MDTVRERTNAFKVGFMQKLAELGILPEELFAKLAGIDELVPGLMGGASSAAGSAVSGVGSLGSLGLKSLIAAPALAGGAAGLGDAMLSAPNGADIELLRKAETLAAYHNAINEINHRIHHRSAHGS